MRRVLAALAVSIVIVACTVTGSDTTHFSCWDAEYLKSQPGLGSAPHKFNAGPGKDHRCTKAELDAAGIPPAERPADQR